ncbi:MAG: zinc ribbon domain-containing protein, partial [Clostridia bacterium]
MLCPNCKKEISDDSKFCGDCGKTLIAENVSNESAPAEPVPAPTPPAAEENKGGGCLKPLIIIAVLIVSLVFLINACSSDDDDDYDTGGYEYE